jgi:hypothetical protein
MLATLRRRLTYANVVSTVCLFVVLGGSAYSATQVGSAQIENNSIRSKDIRNNGVRGRDIRNGTIMSRDVRNGYLLAKDFKPGQLPAGPTGPRGPRGPAGKNGTGGGAGTVTVRTNSDGIPTTCVDGGMGQYECDTSGQGVRASCAPGERATGGGWTGSLTTNVTEERPDPASGTPTGWVVAVRAFVQGSGAPPSTPPTIPFSIYAVCQAG